MSDMSVPQTQALAPLAAGDVAKVNAYLDEQTTLLRLQIEDMRRDEAIRTRSLRVRHAADILKLVLELSVALVAAVAAIAFAAMIWAAANAAGLVVEAFSVPPSFVEKGLTGEVIATKVLDRLAALQSETVSNRAASSYANNWGDDIKVQIPQTGVSFGELNRFLRGWLGHETHISGEIYRTANGITITARTGGVTSPTFTGSDADLDTLITKAAEAIYRVTQPYRYAVYLSQRNRGAEAAAVNRQLIRNGSPKDKPWAYIGLAIQLMNDGKIAQATDMLRKAIALKPNMLLAYENLATGYNTLDNDEQALAAIRKAIALAQSGRDPDVSEDFFAVNPTQDLTTRDLLLGDYQSVLALDEKLFAAPDRVTWETAYQNDLAACGALHDRRCLAKHLAVIPPSTDAIKQLGRQAALQTAEVGLEDWKGVLSLAPPIMKQLRAAGDLGHFYIRHGENPFVALAHAGLGDFKTANRLIADSPFDCVRCVRFRGRIAALQRDWPTAEKWFRHAVALAPSVPFAYAEWGAALLRKGDTQGAIAKFAVAHAKGPHFADPLAMWGEALMLQNRSDLALAKFAEAARYAPNWGRLHLKWGEALTFMGRKDEARKHLAVAASLGLTAGEKTELGKVLRPL